MLPQKGQYLVCNERSHIHSGMLTARMAGPTADVPRFSSQPRAFQESASAQLGLGIYFILLGSVELSIPELLNIVLLNYNNSTTPYARPEG